MITTRICLRAIARISVCSVLFSMAVPAPVTQAAWYDDPVSASPSGDKTVVVGSSITMSGHFSPHHINTHDSSSIRNASERTQVEITTTGCLGSNTFVVGASERERIYLTNPFDSTTYLTVDQWSSSVTAQSAGTGTVTQRLRIKINRNDPQWIPVDLGTQGNLSVRCTAPVVKSSISGRVSDPENKGLSGREIVLTKPNGSRLTRKTAIDGTYRFGDLDLGAYTLRETVPSGWTQVSPLTSTASLSLTGTTPATLDFITRKNDPPPTAIQGEIQGTVRSDTTAPLSGWTVTLRRPDGSSVSATTSSTGVFNFSHLPVGSYTLSETLKSGWTAVSPSQPTQSIQITKSGVVNTGFINKNTVVPPPDPTPKPHGRSQR